MARIRENVWFKHGDKQPRPGILDGCTYTPRERVLRAATMWIGCWLLAPLAFLTLIPVAHLALTVGLLIAGPLIAVSRYRTTYYANSVEGVCPSCEREIKLALSVAQPPPLYTYCPLCGVPVHVVAKAEGEG